MSSQSKESLNGILLWLCLAFAQESALYACWVKFQFDWRWLLLPPIAFVLWVSLILVFDTIRDKRIKYGGKHNDGSRNR